MKGTKQMTQMKTMLDCFNTTFSGNPTRLGVFEKHKETVIDYWLENGMPLLAVHLEPSKDESVSIRILLGNKVGSEASHFTHVVDDVKEIKILLSNGGQTDGMDLVRRNGQITLLRFEDFIA